MPEASDPELPGAQLALPLDLGSPCEKPGRSAASAAQASDPSPASEAAHASDPDQLHFALFVPLEPVQAPRTRKPTLAGHMRIERALRRRLGSRLLLRLTVQDGRALSFMRRRGVHYVSLHPTFQDAPLAVLEALAALIADRGFGPAEAAQLDAYLRRHHKELSGDRGVRLLPRGTVHDLGAIFDQLNADYFAGEVRARITWARARRRQRRRSIQLGSYHSQDRLIRIHPALDQSFVPAYFVASVVFHEMLHERHAVTLGPHGRRCIHSPQFLADEQSFEDHAKARRWQQLYLAKLLRY